MGDEAVKKKLNNAIKAASNKLDLDDYNVRLLDGKPFHLEAIRKDDRFPFDKIRNIRITINKPTKEEAILVADFGLPDNCTREIWYRRGNQKKFNVLKIF